MTETFRKEPMVILEMANNHQGSVEKGKEIIDAYAEVAKKFSGIVYAFKFQLRDIPNFIHPVYKDRDDIKYVKRFKETYLAPDQLAILKDYANEKGFITGCTGFDEASVRDINELGFNFIKVASCSMDDWPLLNEVVEHSLPVIVSTAGHGILDIDKVVSFFKNRDKSIVLMHCVGQYPTPNRAMNLLKLKKIRKTFPQLRVGFSTHENPDNLLTVGPAVTAGASVFEKHVDLDTNTRNAYSTTPTQLERWLMTLRDSLNIVYSVPLKEDLSREQKDLLKFCRGTFVTRDVSAGEIISKCDLRYAFPAKVGQYLANDTSKYAEFKATRNIVAGSPLMEGEVSVENNRDRILAIVKRAKSIVDSLGLIIPEDVRMEISHHHDISTFHHFGLCALTILNNAQYCKKYLIMHSGQAHPEQWHRKKRETFIVLKGTVNLRVNGELFLLEVGDIHTIEPGQRHSFSVTNDTIIEEISTAHYANDSFYTNEVINRNKHRKTEVLYWSKV